MKLTENLKISLQNMILSYEENLESIDEEIKEAEAKVTRLKRIKSDSNKDLACLTGLLADGEKKVDKQR